MAGYNKTRTTPFRLLAYLLYGQFDWIERIATGQVRVQTGPASRFLRLRSARFWECLFWLEQTKLVSKVQKEQRRGTVIIHLTKPEVFTE